MNYTRKLFIIQPIFSLNELTLANHDLIFCQYCLAGERRELYCAGYQYSWSSWRWSRVSRGAGWTHWMQNWKFWKCDKCTCSYNSRREHSLKQHSMRCHTVTKHPCTKHANTSVLCDLCGEGFLNEPSPDHDDTNAWNMMFSKLECSICTVRNTLREIELQNDYCNGCGLTDHGCGMTLLSNELQIRTIGSIPGITGHNWLYHVWHHHNNV